jgi:hypothetical protein
MWIDVNPTTSKQDLNDLQACLEQLSFITNYDATVTYVD